MATGTATEENLSNGHDKPSASQNLRDHVDNAQEKAKDVQDQLQTEMRHLTETGAKFVKENQGTALLVAVGVGLLIGLALKRD